MLWILFGQLLFQVPGQEGKIASSLPALPVLSYSDPSTLPFCSVRRFHVGDNIPSWRFSSGKK